MAELIIIPDDIMTMVGSLPAKNMRILRRLVRTVGEERARELVAEAQALAASSTASSDDAPATVQTVLIDDLLKQRLNPAEQTFVLPPPIPVIPLSPAAQAIADELGGVDGKQRQTLNRLVELVGEDQTRQLAAEAVDQFALLQAQPASDVPRPKSVRALLWTMLSYKLDPPTRSKVLDLRPDPLRSRSATRPSAPSPAQLDPATFIRLVALRLNEKKALGLKQIERLFGLLGPEVMTTFVIKAEQVQAAGGMMTLDGGRPRTLGGVFFTLMREAYPELFLLKSEQTSADGSSAPAEPQIPSLVWAERKQVYQELVTEVGGVRSVKITLSGRPGKVIEKREVVITSMRPEKVAAVPRGVPPPIPTIYSVYISRKQWAKVAESIANPEDILVVEGVASYDPDMEGIVVSATSVTTRMIQQSKRKPPAAPVPETPDPGSTPEPPPVEA